MSERGEAWQYSVPSISADSGSVLSSSTSSSPSSSAVRAAISSMAPARRAGPPASGRRCRGSRWRSRAASGARPSPSARRRRSRSRRRAGSRRILGIRQDRLQSGQVAVNVVEQRKQRRARYPPERLGCRRTGRLVWRRTRFRGGSEPHGEENCPARQPAPAGTCAKARGAAHLAQNQPARQPRGGPRRP